MIGRRNVRGACLAGVVAAALGVLSVSIAAIAQPAAREDVIQGQDLGNALREFAIESGQDVVFDPAAVRGKRTRGLTGSHSAEEGLRILLAGTGLAVERTSSGFAIAQNAASPGRPVTGEAGDENAAAAAGITEIVVTGSRLKALSAEGPTPVTRFTSEDIDRLGANSVAEVLDYLPQQSFSFDDNFNFAGAQSVQLRGLGLGTTLVLINGRRTVTSAAQGARAYFDVNTIPLAAVERIEILSSSSSAVYGADAVAGVVNIILKKDIERPVIDLHYGFTPDGDSEEPRVSASFGASSERFRSAFSVDYFKRTTLFGSEREITADQDFRRFGGPDARRRTANPGNVSSTTGTPLPGLTAPFAAVPVGSSGVGLTPADFLATQGQNNLESTSRFASIVPEAERTGVVASAEYDLSRWATLFGEFMYVNRHDTRTLGPPALSNALVPPANPFNPFGVPVLANFLLTGVDREDITRSESYRVVAGIKGDIGNWQWEVSTLYTNDDADNWITNQIDFGRAAAALAATDPAVAFNPFVDGPGGTPAVVRSILADKVVNRFGSTAKQVTGFVSGSLFDLPGGSVDLVVGGEARKEEIGFDIPGAIPNLAADRDTSAFFGEIRIPIVSSAMDVPLVERLTLTAAGRHDHYNDIGDTFNPQVGLEWLLSRDLLLRASSGTSFRPPALFELYQPQITIPGVPITDFRRSNEQYLAGLTLGGNPDLDPEEARSWSAGFVFTPVWLSGLRISADYWHIKQDQRVQRFTPQDVLINESTFPDRVVRAPPTPAEAAAGIPGRVVSIEASNLNFGGVQTDGVDIDASYRIQTGMGVFVPSVRATYIDKFKAAQFPNQPAVERVGIANREGTIPEWRGTGSLSWSLGGWQASTTARYIDGYQDASFFGVPTGTRVKSQTLVDLQAGYTFGTNGETSPSFLDDLAISIGAINAFDAEPRFSNVAALFGTGYDSSLADLRQRFLYVKLAKTF